MAYLPGSGGGKKPGGDSLIGGVGDFAQKEQEGKKKSFEPTFLSEDKDGSRFKRGGSGDGDSANKGSKAYGAGKKIGQDIKEGAQAIKNVAKTAKQTFGNNTQVPGGGVKGALKKAEGQSGKPQEAENKSIAKGEAAAKTAVRATGAAVAVGAALVGKEDTAVKIFKNLLQQLAKEKGKFIKDTAVGILMLAGIFFLAFGTMVMMFTFIAVFTVQHVSETTKKTALNLTTIDESFEAGKAIFSAGQKGWSAVFGTTQLTSANYATLRSQDGTLRQGNDPSKTTLADTNGVAANTKVTQLLDKLDISKILENLGETDTFLIERNGKKVPYKDIETINPATDKLYLSGNIIDLNGDPHDPAFMNKLSIAIRSSNLFKHSSRTMLSKPVKKIYADAGINLQRWEGSAEKVTDYGKNIKSSYDSVSKGITKNTTLLKDIDAAGEKTSEVATKLLDANPSSRTKNYVSKTVNGAWAGVANIDNSDNDAVEKFTAKYQSSPGLFTIASYCSARSYITAYETIAKEQYNAAQRNGVKILSSADQIKVGKTGRQAVGGEAQRHESYETSRAYQKAIGGDVRNRTPDLDESQLAYQDPRIVKAAMQSIVDMFEQPFSDEGFVNTIAELLQPDGGWVSSVVGFVTGALSTFVNFALTGVNTILAAFGKGNLQQIIAQEAGKLLCAGMSNEEAQLAIQIADKVSGALPGPSAGDIGSAAVLLRVKESLNSNGAKVLAKQLGLEGSVFNKPTAEMIYFMFNSHKGLNYSGLDDGVDLISKEFEGASAFGNDVSRAGGGRPLTTAECAEAKGVANEQNAIIRREKPLLTRLFSPKETYSPVSLALAHSPLSTQGTVDKTRTLAMNSINPINTVVATTQKIAYSTSVVDRPALAVSDNAEDNQLCIGYSVAERKKMTEDGSFWPVQNSVTVEANMEDLKKRFGDCYSEPMSALITADATDTESVSAYGGRCSADALNNDDALRYRAYTGSVMQLESLTDMQTIAEDAKIEATTPGTTPDGEITEEQTVVVNNCGGGARTSTSWAEKVEELCAAASAAGTPLTIGNSWRPTSEQIELRKANCGTSQYAIYEAPAKSCSPPTAKPGQSNHQRGVAIDFENCTTQSTDCFKWLSVNAATYGIKNLPDEAWHWSIDGA